MDLWGESMIQISSEIKKAFIDLGKNFALNELAYISLTGKNENFIRDNLALILNNVSNEVVTREYKRIDIVQFNSDNKTLKSAIEITNLHAFQIVDYEKFTSKKGYEQKILKDFIKNKSLNLEYMLSETKIYNIIVATNVKKAVPNEMKHLIKYNSGINRSPLLDYSEDFIKVECENILRKHIITDSVGMEYCLIHAGKAFNIAVDLHVWILEKKPHLH